jgi:hypothetical protein
MWRVTGAINQYASTINYKFCGITGEVSSQIKFKIDTDGSCVPLQYSTIMDLCAEEQYMMYLTETELILHGTVHIEGIQTANLTEAELNVLRSTITEEFNDVKKIDASVDGMVDIESWSLLPSSSSLSSIRRLYVVSVNGHAIHQIDFRVQLVAEHFISSTDNSLTFNVEDLRDDLSTYMMHSMKSGLFATKLMSHAMKSNVRSMQSLKSVKLQSLNIIHKSADEHNIISITADIVVVVGGLSGMIAGVMLLLYFIRKPHQRDVITMGDLEKSSAHDLHLSYVSRNSKFIPANHKLFKLHMPSKLHLLTTNENKFVDDNTII